MALFWFFEVSSNLSEKARMKESKNAPVHLEGLFWADLEPPVSQRLAASCSDLRSSFSNYRAHYGQSLKHPRDSVSERAGK